MGLPKMTDKKEVYLKKRKQAVHMLADVGMAVLLPLLMAYSLIGEAVHEWMDGYFYVPAFYPAPCIEFFVVQKSVSWALFRFPHIEDDS